MHGGTSAETRAQSSPLALALLFGVVITVSIAVVIAGGAVLEQSQRATSMEGATMTMYEVDSTVATLGTDPGTTRSVTVGDGTRGGDLRVEQAGTMSITIEDAATGTALLDESYDLGRIVLERGDRQIAYQGGGVWRSEAGSSNSALVSGPNFDYRYHTDDPTVSIPVVSVTGEAGDRSLSLRQDGDPDTRFPRGSGTTNPLDSGQSLSVTVQSQYYKAWGTYFERATNGSVDYDHGARRVTLTMESPEQTHGGSIAGPLVTSDVGRLQTFNYAAFGSYDSSTGTPYADGSTAPIYVRGVYRATNHVDHAGDVIAADRAVFEGPDFGTDPTTIDGETVTGGDPTDADATEVVNMVRFGENVSTDDDLRVYGGGTSASVFRGDVLVGGDLVEFNNVVVEGSVYVQGDVGSTVSNPNATIEGDLVVDGTVAPGFEADVQGEIRDQSDGADPPEPATPTFPDSASTAPLIDRKESALQDPNNDNDNVSNFDAIATNWQDPCTTECTIESGRYYFDEGLVLDSEKLLLNASDGPIELYLAPSSSYSGQGLRLNDANVTVVGNHTVSIYTDGDVVIDELSGAGYEAGVYTRPDPRVAPNVRLYVDPSRSVSFSDDGGGTSPQFTGVVDGSGGTADGAEFTLTNHAKVYGAILGDVTDVNSHAEIHFDEALLGDGDDEDGENATRVEYVHVSNRTIEVSR